MDEPTGEGSFQTAVQIDVNALCNVAYGEGYEKGVNDLMARLMVLEIFTREENGECLQSIIDTADTLVRR